MKQVSNILLIVIIIVLSNSTSFSQDLDLSFATNGKSVIDFNSQMQYVNTVKIQTDGKILVCGKNTGPEEYFILRYTTAGVLDNSFDSDGKLIFTIPGATTGGFSHTMSLQSDGKILIGGEDFDGTNVGSVIIRINTDGTFDNTFGSNGIVRFAMSSYEEAVTSILVLSSNKIVTVGSASDGTLTYIYIAKFNSDGTFDTSFDTDGKITLTGSTFDNRAIVQLDDKLVLGNGSNVLRLNTDGTMDNSFGTNGIVTLTGIDIRSLVLLESNKIALAGTQSSSFAIARLNTDGSTDNTFGTSGLNVLTPAGLEATVNVFMRIVEDTTNNNLLACGHSYNSNTTLNNMAVVEFLSDGTLDNYTTVKIGNNSSDAFSIAIQEDRKIIVAGTAGNALNDDVAVIRLNADFDTFVTETIASQNINIGLNLFPNPASQTINIHSSSAIQNVIIFDVLGNEILNYEVHGNTQLDISSLPKGLYNFVISTDKGTGTKKVSIQ